MSAERVARRFRAVVALSAVVAMMVSACSVEQAVPMPSCERGGSVLITAQSVSTATQVPCLSALPAGWTVATVRVNEHHTVVTLDSDRAGESAAVLRFEDACDVTDAVSAPSDLPAVQQYDLIERLAPGYRADRYYVFRGGCVSWSFDFDKGASATEAVAINATLVLNSRKDFNDSFRESFIDEDI